MNCLTENKDALHTIIEAYTSENYVSINEKLYNKSGSQTEHHIKITQITHFCLVTSNGQ